jgi:hypothetical protein
MIKVSFRNKVTFDRINRMSGWVRDYRSNNVTYDFAHYHHDGTATWTYWFSSERDAVIFKLRFA